MYDQDAVSDDSELAESTSHRGSVAFLYAERIIAQDPITQAKVSVVR